MTFLWELTDTKLIILLCQIINIEVMKQFQLSIKNIIYSQLINIILIFACSIIDYNLHQSYFSKQIDVGMSVSKIYSKSSKHIKSSKKGDMASRSLLDDFDAPFPASCVDLRPFRQVDQESQFIICEDQSDQGEMKQVHDNQLFNPDIHSIDKIMQSCNFHQQLFQQQKHLCFQQSPQSLSKYSTPLNNSNQVQSSLKRQAPIHMDCQNLTINQTSATKVRVTNDNKIIQKVHQYNTPSTAVKSPHQKIFHQDEAIYQSNSAQSKKLRTNIIISNQQKNSKDLQTKNQQKLLTKFKKVKRIFCKEQNQECISSSHFQDSSYKPKVFQVLDNQNKLDSKHPLVNVKLFKAKQKKQKKRQKLIMHQNNMKNISQQIQQLTISPDVKLQAQNTQKHSKTDKMFQLINQYSDLIFMLGLIEELITIYDNGYLFRFSLDFSSGEDEEDQISTENQEIINACSAKSRSYKVKEISKNRIYTAFQIQRLNLCQNIQQRLQLEKQMKFEKSDTFINNFQIIRQLRPYLRKMTLQDKRLFITFKQDLLEVKDLIEHYEKTHLKSDQHICRICGFQFENGRQLGGHMSRKHPGKAFEYGIRRDNQRTKQVERIRRQYFKVQKNKNEPIVKIEYQD